MSKIDLLNQLLEFTVWLTIKNYPNYQISICGKVRNVTTKRILQPAINVHGYYVLNLCNGGKVKMHKIHQLVCKTFIPNIDNKKCIDHIDSNRLNNTISNLRWASHQENQYNRLLNKNSTSGIKGVSFLKNRNKWECYIKINYKKINLGLFSNIEDAKLARQLKASELFGEFLNEIEK